MWSDIKRIRSSGKELAASSGRPTTMVGRITNLPADLAASADMAESAAGQQRQAMAGPEHIEGGLPGVAVIDGGFRTTGEMYGFQPVGDLVLDIQLDGREPYRETVRTAIPYERLTLMTHARRLAVVVDPADRTHLIIDWTKTP
jgi:hypothetical protein